MATFALTGQKSPLAQGNFSPGWPNAVPNGFIGKFANRFALNFPTFNANTAVNTVWASGISASPIFPLPGGGGSGDNPVGVPIDNA